MFLNKYILKKHLPSSPHRYSHSRWRGMRIGLLGGSFNPPHTGHMHIALAALRRYKLHAIWWLVSPQNPLKDPKNNFKKRLKMTNTFVSHPKMHVSGIERDFKIQYSLQTIKKLNTYFSTTQFHWIAGMDNANYFHQWNGWKQFLNQIPITFFNRPPQTMAIHTNKIKLFKGTKNAHFQLTGRTRNISSTEIRNKTFASRLKSAI